MQKLKGRRTYCAKEVFSIEANSILALKDKIGENFEQAIDLLYNCKGRVIVTGMGKPGHIGKKIAASLASTGTPAFFVHSMELGKYICHEFGTIFSLVLHILFLLKQIHIQKQVQHI